MAEISNLAALFTKYPSLKRAFETGVESHDGREEKLLSFILAHPNLSDFKAHPTKLLEAIDEFSYQHDFLISIGANKAGIVHSLILEQRPKIVLELGGYLGYSAILFANAMRSANGGSIDGLKVWSLELSEEFADIARKLIEIAGLSQVVNVVIGEASTTLPRLKEGGKLGVVDFLFLDHVETLYPSDFNICEKLGLFRRGSVVVADNVVRPGAPEYRELIRGLKDWRSTGVRGLIQPGDLEDELEVSYFEGTALGGVQ